MSGKDVEVLAGTGQAEETLTAAGGHGPFALEAHGQRPVRRLRSIRASGVSRAVDRLEGLQVTGGGGEAATATFGQFDGQAKGGVPAIGDRKQDLLVQPEVR